MTELILIVDLEATCWPPGSPERPRQSELSEIIELGAVLTEPILRERPEPPPRFERLIRPSQHPTLTPFCEELTGIHSAELTDAPALAQALEELWAWMERESGVQRSEWSLTLASWGAFDRGILKRQAGELGLWLPDWTHVDLKRVFERWCRRHRREGVRFGLRKALDARGLTHEGPAHRALSDALAAWRLWAHIHSPEQLSEPAAALLGLIQEQGLIGPLRWSRSLPRPLDHKASFERAALELLDARFIEALEHGRGYVEGARARLLSPLKAPPPQTPDTAQRAEDQPL